MPESHFAHFAKPSNARRNPNSSEHANDPGDNHCRAHRAVRATDRDHHRDRKADRERHHVWVRDCVSNCATASGRYRGREASPRRDGAARRS